MSDKIIDFGDYIKNVLKTDKVSYARAMERLALQTRVVHGILGISTEASELEDLLKKNVFYNKPISLHQIEEEIGDIMWYVAILCHELDMDFARILDKNVKKLHARYPEGFTEKDALNRDLEKEEKILKGEDKD